MSTKLGFTTRLAALLVGIVMANVLTTQAFSQGDEPSFRANESGEGRGLGSTLQRFFGSREKAPEQSDRPQTPPRAPLHGLKPGVFQGGIVKQLRGVSAEDSEASHLRVEASKTPTEEQFLAPVPTSPSKMAQRAAGEPFASNNSSPSNNRSVAPQRTVPARDVFADDPPSIVGTGVEARKSVPTARPEPKAFGAQDELPPITKAQTKSSPNLMPPSYNAYKNTSKHTVEEELPRVSRKTIPAGETVSKPVTPQNGYAIPNNPYTSPGVVSSGESSSNRNSTRAAPPTQNPVAPPKESVSSTPPSIPQEKPLAPTTQPARPVTSGSEMRLEMGVPKVKLFVSGPSSLQVGKAIPYEVLVRNEGADLLGGVIVSMNIPASVKSSLPVATAGEFESDKDAAGNESLLWHVADLGPSQSRVFRVSLEATKAEHFGMDVEWTVLPQTGRVEVDVQQPQLTLLLEGPSEVMWGKPEVYRMRVRNPGNAEVKDVEVRLTAEAYGSNQTKLGNIPAGSERIVEVELTFQHSGSIKIAGEAQSLVDTLDSSSSIDVVVKQVNLTAEWTGPAEQYQGSVAAYSMKLSNASSIAAESITCTTTIPAGLRMVSMPEGASLAGNEIRWSVSSLEANASLMFDFTFQAIESGATKLLSNIQCQGGGKAAAEALVQIESVSDLKLSVTDPVAPAPVGQDVAYDLTIVNRGSKAAKAVKLIAQFSNGIEPTRAEGGAARVLPGQVVFEPIMSIEPGQEVTLRVYAQAAEPGMHRFRAELECEESETQLVEEETTRYLATSRTDSSKTTIRR